MATYRSVADGVAQRVRMGAPLKVQGVEIGAIRISSTPQARDAAAGVFLDDGTRDEERVEYYFGGAWHNRIFPSIARENGFAVSTAAYGPFLCTAKVFFNDGSTTMLHRYVDFEMGDFAPSSAGMSAPRGAN